MQIFERPQIVDRMSVLFAIVIGFLCYFLNSFYGHHTFQSFGTYGVIGGVAFIGIRKFYDSIAWRWRVVQWLVEMPDFSGRWEGWYYNAARKDWRPIAHVIEQHAGFIESAKQWGGTGAKIEEPRSNSTVSMVAAIFAPASGPQLHFSYLTTPLGADAGGRHEGLQILKMREFEGLDFLIGEYINNRDNSYLSPPRPPGSTGHTILVRADRGGDGLSYSEESWPIKQPEKSRTPTEETWKELQESAIERRKARVGQAQR